GLRASKSLRLLSRILKGVRLRIPCFHVLRVMRNRSLKKRKSVLGNLAWRQHPLFCQLYQPNGIIAPLVGVSDVGCSGGEENQRTRSLTGSAGRFRLFENSADSVIRRCGVDDVLGPESPHVACDTVVGRSVGRASREGSGTIVAFQARRP